MDYYRDGDYATENTAAVAPPDPIDKMRKVIDQTLGEQTERGNYLHAERARLMERLDTIDAELQDVDEIVRRVNRAMEVIDGQEAKSVEALSPGSGRQGLGPVLGRY